MKKILRKTKKIKLIFMLFVLFLIFIVFFYSKKIQAIEKTENYNNTLNKNVNPIKIEEILEQNTSSNVTEEMNIEEIDLEYNTEYKNNDNLPKGTMQVVQEGKDGKQKVIAIKKIENGNLISEEIVADYILKPSIDKIVEIGTDKDIFYK